MTESVAEEPWYVDAPPTLRRIVSGGQSGVDRAALDVALALGLLCGGWCPKGRKAEDGELPSHYPLRDTPSDGYVERTTWNVRDSDGTLIINQGRLSSGTLQTLRDAQRLNRPCLVVQIDPSGRARSVRDADGQRVAVPSASQACHIIINWILAHGIETLNVAGPRQSKRPGIDLHAAALLRELLRPAASRRFRP